MEAASWTWIHPRRPVDETGADSPPGRKCWWQWPWCCCFPWYFSGVETFEVSGNVRYTAEEVAEASGITKGDILMAVNKTRTASRLLVKLPYVEEVRVSGRHAGHGCGLK